MLNFVDISKELSYQQKDGIPSLLMGIEYALKNSPLDFQYSASEAVTSFDAVKVNGIGEIIETISLSTSLITYDSVNNLHKCDGLTDYTNALDCGYYYFLVNDKFQSEYFNVLSVVEEATTVNEEISLSGLKFYNINNDIADLDKAGAPILNFGTQFATNTRPLEFEYLANEAVSKFEAIKIDNLGNLIEIITLDTDLIEFNSNSHKCSSNNMLNTFLKGGNYYLNVNDKFHSDSFFVANLTKLIVENIDLSNTIERRYFTLNFDAFISGIESSLDVEFTFTFSLPIGNFSETHTITSLSTSISNLILIPEGVIGMCTLFIENNLDCKVFQKTFNITSLINCLELYGGGSLELYSGGCLELYQS